MDGTALGIVITVSLAYLATLGVFIGVFGQRFSGLEQRFSGLEQRLGAIEAAILHLTEAVGEIRGEIRSLAHRVERLET